MKSNLGKTFTAVNIAIRLLKFGGARRILFPVDRGNLGKQTEDEFANFTPPDDTRTSFPETIVRFRLSPTCRRNGGWSFSKSSCRIQTESGSFGFALPACPERADVHPDASAAQTAKKIRAVISVALKTSSVIRQSGVFVKRQPKVNLLAARGTRVERVFDAKHSRSRAEAGRWTMGCDRFVECGSLLPLSKAAASRRAPKRARSPDFLLPFSPETHALRTH